MGERGGGGGGGVALWTPKSALGLIECAGEIEEKGKWKWKEGTTSLDRYNTIYFLAGMWLKQWLGNRKWALETGKWSLGTTRK